jgi:two-component system cell cycle response regulator
MTELKQDRRRLPRKRTLKKGRIVFNNRNSVLDCVVRNLSAQGALLIVPSVFGIPDEFQLYIDSAGCHAAHVIWRGKSSLGVSWEH